MPTLVFECCNVFSNCWEATFSTLELFERKTKFDFIDLLTTIADSAKMDDYTVGVKSHKFYSLRNKVRLDINYESLSRLCEL